MGRLDYDVCHETMGVTYLCIMGNLNLNAVYTKNDLLVVIVVITILDSAVPF